MTQSPLSDHTCVLKYLASKSEIIGLVLKEPSVAADVGDFLWSIFFQTALV